MSEKAKLNVEESTASGHRFDFVRLTKEALRTAGVVTGETIGLQTDDGEIIVNCRSTTQVNPTDGKKVILSTAQMEELGVESGDSVEVDANPNAAPPSRRKESSSKKQKVQDELARLREQKKNQQSSNNSSQNTMNDQTEAEDDESNRPQDISYEDVGGLDEELDKIREMIELPLREPEMFEDFGVSPPKGVLMYGPPGTGKTLTAKAIANEANARFFEIEGPEIMSKYKGESEAEIRQVFENARGNDAAIIFIDELDAIASKRSDDSEAENRIVAQFLSEMDGMQSDENVVVIAATNRVDSIDTALRRGGRFDREIEIGVPDETGRLDILEILSEGMPLSDNVNLERLAAQTHGFVGADLDALTREAGLRALQRARSSGDADDGEVTMDDFRASLTEVEPSAMREFVKEMPDTTFDDIGGLDNQKQRLRESVEWPANYSELFDAANTSPPSGIMLHGPSGTGKTLLARALAGESDINFIRVQGPEIIDKYVGESEKAVRELFDKAQQSAPTILFFDGIEAIASEHGHEVTERVASQMEVQMSNIADNPDVMVLAATTDIDSIDAQLRTRFDEEIETNIPTKMELVDILDVHLDGKPVSDDVDSVEIVDQVLDNDSLDKVGTITGNEIERIVRSASMNSIRRVADGISPSEASDHTDSVEITRDDIVDAIEDRN